MDTIQFSAARQSLAKLLDRVVADKTPVEISRRDKPSVIVVDKNEYEGMMETIHLLSSPRNAERLMQGIAALEAGDGVSFDPADNPSS
ncbi:MAG: type II toxin-antitoxin system prevent-host-death family antitoxin [Sphingomonadales bacterium]|nr:type II toxin-antitoxin system prevent-host-death family antitoxin [Sphingomonadales bacterium]